MIKLFNVNEGTWKEDMEVVAKLAAACGLKAASDATPGEPVTIADNIDTAETQGLTATARLRLQKSCCQSHNEFYSASYAKTHVETSLNMRTNPISLCPDSCTSGPEYLDTAGPDFVTLYSQQDLFLKDILSVGVDLSDLPIEQ